MGGLKDLINLGRQGVELAQTVQQAVKAYDKIKDSPLGKKLNEKFGDGKRPEGAEVSKPEDIAAVLNSEPPKKSGIPNPFAKKPAPVPEEQKLGLDFKVQSFDLQDGKPPIKILTAELTPEQSKNLSKMLEELSPDQKKKFFGGMDVSMIDADPNGKPPTPAMMSISNPAQVQKGAVEEFMKDGRKDALKAAILTGNTDGVKAKVDATPAAPAASQTSSIPADLNVAGLNAGVQGGVDVAGSSAATLGGGGTREVSGGGRGAA